MIRWGMIGCGDVTEKKSGPAYRIENESVIHGVTSRTLSRAEDYAKRHGIETVFNSAEELINSPDIDAVYIATPPATHFELAMKIAESGKPCSVEKPLALNYSQSLEMAKAFEAVNQPLFVAYYRRTLPRFDLVKELLERQELGKVRHVQWSLTRPEGFGLDAGWRIEPSQAPGGLFDDLACHGLDLLDHYLGKINIASGVIASQQLNSTITDSVAASWIHESGVTGSGYWNFAGFEQDDDIEIICVDGKICVSVFEDKPVRIVTREGVKTYDISHPDHIQKHYVEQMVLHMKGQATHPSLAQSGCRTAWVCDQILGQ